MFRDIIYNLLSKKRDQKRHEVLKLQWEKAELERQLEQLKALKKEQDAGGAHT